MAEYKIVPVDQITVPADRLRRVDEQKAFLVGQSIAAGGQIHPVTVYRTPRGARPYTLAAGATRHRGHELHGLKEIAVLIRKMDKNGARRIEIEENLFRDELSKLDRAMHVVEYRRLWEEEHGKVRRGNPALSNSANLAELDNAQAHFYEQALDDLGLSRRAIERAQFIGANLLPDLRELIARTPVADNQSELERLAKLPPEKQKQTAVALQKTGDLALAKRVVDRKPKAEIRQLDPQQRECGRLIDAWERAGEEARREFLDHIGAALRKPRETMPSVSEIVGEIEGGGRPGPSANHDLRRHRAS